MITEMTTPLLATIGFVACTVGLAALLASMTDASGKPKPGPIDLSSFDFHTADGQALEYNVTTGEWLIGLPGSTSS